MAAESPHFLVGYSWAAYALFDLLRGTGESNSRGGSVEAAFVQADEILTTICKKIPKVLNQ